MKIRLIFVPPGGGEADYSLLFDLPALPRPGDYISITKPKEVGTHDFIVRRTWWQLKSTETRVAVYSTDVEIVDTGCEISVECEYSIGEYAAESHKQACAGYIQRNEIKKFEASAY